MKTREDGMREDPTLFIGIRHNTASAGNKELHKLEKYSPREDLS